MPTKTFVSSRAKLALMVLVAIGFTAIGVMMILDPEPQARLFGWLAVLFFGVLGIPALGFQVFRPSTLELGEDAVVMTSGFGKRFVIKWLDVDHFGVWSVRRAKMAGYIYKEGRRPNTVMQNLASGTGVDGAFANSWPIKPQALVDLLETYRRNAEARAGR